MDMAISDHGHQMDVLANQMQTMADAMQKLYQNMDPGNPQLAPPPGIGASAPHFPSPFPAAPAATPAAAPSSGGNTLFIVPDGPFDSDKWDVIKKPPRNVDPFNGSTPPHIPHLGGQGQRPCYG